MKHSSITILLTVLMSMVGANVFAYDFSVENADGVTIYYNYINDGTELAVTYRGTSYSSYSNRYTGNVVIPEEVTYMNRTRMVTSIGDGAFRGCSKLTSVIIGNSVTSIGYGAFMACYNLTSVTIPNNVISIDERAFASCSKLTSINIPNSLTSIGRYAFYGCINFTFVNIPNSVTSIGDRAFENCSKLNSLTIGNGVTSIGYEAFSNCNLTSITIPNSVTSIGLRAFDGCDISTVISLIENPFTIYGKVSPNYRTFSQNTFNNATLFVPKGTIDKYKATEGWKDFKDIVEGTGPNGEGETPVNPNPGDDPIINGTCGESVNYSYDKHTQTLTVSGNGTMANYEYGQNEAPWFSYANEIKSIEIGSGITSISNFTFYKCSSVTSITLPATVTSIGSSAFEDCTSLTSLSLNEGLQYIGGSAFESCTGLESITLPSTVNTIMLNAFKNCRTITDVYCYAENVPNTAEDAFDGTPTEKSTLHVPAPAIGAYRSAWPWSDFKEIVALTDVGIMEVKQSNGNDEYYDLTGRKVHHPQKGLYIRNGKKVIIM